MSIIDNYKDPIVSQWNKYAEIVENEPHVVTSGMFALTGLPDIQQRVVINGYVEIGDKDKIESSDEFKVDYTNGYVFMHSSKEGETINVTKYANRGVNLYPASRVWTKLTADGNIDETLEDITNEIDDALDISNQIQSAEDVRKSSENQRISDENIRKSNELTRKSNEETRISNESTRVSDEDIRKANEIVRKNNEDARILSEIQRETDEDFRKSNEIERVSNESIRQSNEQTRVDNEATRQLQETERQTNTSTALNSINDTNANFKIWEDYDNLKLYKPLNKVQYQGSSYVNILECQGLAPTNISNWQLVASKGQDGVGGDMYKYVYDSNDNGIVDMAEKVNGYTVESNVPANAKFTDTITPIVNNLTTTVEGSALDATQGKILDDKIGISLGLRISVGSTQPTDTVFWLDTTP